MPTTKAVPKTVRISGFIPHELGSLSKLQHLDLANNHYLTGSTGNFEWLFNLSSLTHLDLSNINMATSSIWASLIQSIPSISVMRLNHCNLSAPSFTSSNFSSSISTLHLYGNCINSSIFKWLPHLRGSLVELDLGYNMLEGRIPQSFGHMTSLTLLNLGNNLLTGPIPQSFGNMTALTHLSLDHNLLYGPIPYSFALMTALTYLNLSANQLVLPKSIYNLSSLQVADFSSNNFTGNLEDLLSGAFPHLQEMLISENQFTGSLPDITLLPFLRNLQVGSNQLNGYLPKAFGHHSALRCLDLSNNQLRGFLPDFTGFSSLEFLYLNNNKFSGSIPDFTGCSSLQVLRLSENQLTEWETQSTGLLSTLIELDLSMNSICSTVSEAHLSNLSSLKFMRTSFNALTFDFSSKWLPPFQLRELSLASCKLGPKFPNWIRNQGYIDHLDLSNSQISDTIPMWFWSFSSIRNHLNLSSNEIRGKFSSELVYVQEIDLSSNYFDGPLPPISAECLKINLSQNKFSGTLLSLSVVEELFLRFLDISHNELSGALPDNWMHFQGLVFLNLGFNNFSGRIPTSIGHLVSLQTLILRNNNLYGELPASLRNCSGLGFADFGLNKLSGKVPSWIGEDLLQLYALILKSNRFYGSMPHELCYLSNLHFLDMSINMISGTIPPCVHNRTAMIKKGTEVAEHIYSSVDAFSNIIVVAPAGAPITNFSYFDNALARWKGQEFQYGSNFAYLKMIDLSTNNLTGEIPIGVTKLLELNGLNLSGNRLNGKVPLEIGQLKGLECLDLSTNKFSGTQLQGFNTSTYEGNPGLCGKPLINICPGDEPADQAGLSSSNFEINGDDSEYKRWLYISVVLGFSTTFWGVSSGDSSHLSRLINDSVSDCANGSTDHSNSTVSDDAISKCTFTPGGRRYYVHISIDEACIPVVNKLFDCMEEGMEFYQAYGRLSGFNTRHSTEKTDDDDNIVRKYVVCSRAGFNEKKLIVSNKKSSQVKRRRTVSNRCGCGAKIILRAVSGKTYRISTFVEEHNHDLVPKSGRQFMRVNRQMSIISRKFVFDAANVNIGVSKSHSFMKEQVGG
ncbi:receptor-like protein EIX1 [Heracleum sosnowskyi]|uniref:Receptor-like protein EIX1 n=1 Tax=Heracleum sosnowskyi TaxID=360622 RepID=A0AAD8HB23_9APIA|nr:receptor-like protein EIX1 [Heracleum sosnowskyi]